MSVVYYRIAENHGTHWDWVTLPLMSLHQAYAFCHFNHSDINMDNVVIIGSTNSAKLTYYLKNHILGEGPTVVISAKQFLVTRQFNVELEERRMESWVIGEAEKHLERIQKYPNLEHDEQKIKKRLEFMKHLVVNGHFAHDLGTITDETP